MRIIRKRKNIFSKVLALMIVSAIIAGAFVLFTAIINQTQFMEESLIRENILIAKIVAQGIESGYPAREWPFETFKRIRESKNILFWWVVKPNGEIYQADDVEVWGKRIDDKDVGTKEIVVKDSFYSKTNQKIKLILYPLNIKESGVPWTLYLGISLESITAARNQMILYSFSTFIVIVTLVTLFSYYSAKSFTRPIEKLTEACGRISRGDFTAKINIKTRDELEALADSFNLMQRELKRTISELKKKTEKLNQAKHELEEWSKTLEVKVRERTKELMETQEQLIHSEKMATIGTLAGGVAHEINNPMLAILISTQTLLKDITDENQRKSLLRIEESTKRCRDIVQTLLRYSRKPEVGEFKSIDLNKVISDSCNLLQHQLEKDNVKIETEYGDIARIEGNPNELQQVFTNLILNAGDAIKKTGKPGKITIRTSQEGKFIVSNVIDNGIGIPEENIKRIFDPFFTTKDVGEGTGLGLSIAYKIIEKHKGEIDVSSKVGKGTTFTIKLPK